MNAALSGRYSVQESKLPVCEPRDSCETSAKKCDIGASRRIVAGRTSLLGRRPPQRDWTDRARHFQPVNSGPARDRRDARYTSTRAVRDRRTWVISIGAICPETSGSLPASLNSPWNLGSLSPDSHQCFVAPFRRIYLAKDHHLERSMTTTNSTLVGIAASNILQSAAGRVLLTRWINEPLPDIRLLLSSRDVARITRRPRWQVLSLTVLGRFPRRHYYQGRSLGWHRDDVLAWLTQGLSLAPKRSLPRFCATRHPRQPCLPLDCKVPCTVPADAPASSRTVVKHRPHSQKS